MAGPMHTYGPTCLLTDDDPDLSAWFSSPTPPRPRPQFFYTSALPIDDPLTSLPPPSGGQGPNDGEPPQPFSAKDNIALEGSWKALRENFGRKVAAKAAKSREGTSTRNSVVSVPGASQRRDTVSRHDASPFESQQNSPVVSAPALENRPLRNAKARPEHRASCAELRPRGPGSWERLRTSSMQDDEMRDGSRSANIAFRKRERSSFSHNVKTARPKTSASLAGEDAGVEELEGGSGRATPHDASISGSPFARAPIPSHSPFGRSIESGSYKGGEELPADQGLASNPIATKPSGLRMHQDVDLDGSQTEAEEHLENQDFQARVPVGVSRLHLVELPNLKVLLLPFNHKIKKR